MPSTQLLVRYRQVLAPHEEAVDALVPLLVEMALMTIAEVVQGTAAVRTFGDVDEDGVPRLRVLQVFDEAGGVRFDVARDAEERVDVAIAQVEAEYLERLIGLTGDELFGEGFLEATPDD